ncbi:MAG TPA: methylenetetrahydrofolate reductase [Stellaceae bacterium]|nr:methylenetetrahydrofolate reductase [Stellaceae bacterium]
MDRPRPAPDDRRARRMAQLIGAASIEISPRDDPAREGLGELLAPGTTVFVNHPGSVTHHDVVAACVRLRRAGFDPVPHVAVRRLASFTQARDFVQRAAGEAAVSGVLLVGGDPAQAAGPFRDSADLLATGLVESHGIGRVAFAGYPEGHPSIDRRSLEARLRAKLALARRQGLDASIVTQFVFEAAPVDRWVRALRDDGIACPVRVGVAGPATVATLAKFAVRCGIGASLRALGRGQTAFARILAEATPDALVEALAAGADRGAPVDGLHLFTFGGVRRTAEWIRARADRTQP